MKKKYIIPHTEIITLNIQEKLMWGELANPSNQNPYTGAKPFDWFKEDMTPVDEEEFWDEYEEDQVTTVAKKFNVWNDDL